MRPINGTKFVAVNSCAFLKIYNLEKKQIQIAIDSQLHGTQLLEKNKSLSKNQSILETESGQCAMMNQLIAMKEAYAREQKQTLAKSQLAIDNIGSICYQHRHSKKKPAKMTVFDQLDFIQDFILDLEQTVNLAVKLSEESDTTGVEGDSNNTTRTHNTKSKATLSLKEDSDVRAISQSRSRGGNASTNAAILAQLGWDKVEFIGSIGNTTETDFCLYELKKYGVIVENCIKHEGLVQPNTCAIINKSNGSRTLIHYHGGFPEINYQEFSGLNLNLYKLIHLEGRTNVDELNKILRYISDWNSIDSHKIVKTSFELEKPLDFSSILSLPDVLFVSSEYASSMGHQDMQTALLEISKHTKEGSLIVCAWGSNGACGGIKRGCPMTSGDIVSVSAFPPPEGVKDTLGAGDCFIAACLFALMIFDDKGLNNDVVSRVIKFGCKIAGYKCGQYGFHLNNETISQYKQEFF
ncbi:Ketohexokinase-like [Oopsacas minuta]|uniref:Ketohexokinase-like n=1 Tax=Oopsacas minuta TaxID=111878 RepID=A0AAV7KE38_9METZ|nr:Ketohexokinase-like [Oopsacas minuta]